MDTILRDTSYLDTYYIKHLGLWDSVASICISSYTIVSIRRVARSELITLARQALKLMHTGRNSHELATTLNPKPENLIPA